MSPSRRARTAGPILAVLLVCSIPQLALAARLWTLVGTPLTASVGVSTAVTLNVQNIGGSGGGDEIGCVQIDVPTSFSISSFSIVSIKGQTSGHGWEATTSSIGGAVRVTFQNPSDDNVLVGLPLGHRAVFRIVGTPTVAGLITWVGRAYDKAGSGGGTDCGSGTFPTLTILLTVALPSLPTPTPAPTPPPTPPPTPTPAATPAATPSATTPPSPSTTPRTTPAPTPVPTAPPKVDPTTMPSAAGSQRPDGSARPSPSPTSGPGASSTPPPDASADPSEAGNVGGPGAPGGGAGGGQPGPISGGAGPDGSASSNGGASGGAIDADGPVFSIGGDGPVPEVPLIGAEFAGFDSIDWAVPALTLTVPGLLLMLAVLAQLTAGAIWLPVARRWLGAFGMGRRRRRATPAEGRDP